MAELGERRANPSATPSGAPSPCLDDRAPKELEPPHTSDLSETLGTAAISSSAGDLTGTTHSQTQADLYWKGRGGPQPRIFCGRDLRRFFCGSSCNCCSSAKVEQHFFGAGLPNVLLAVHDGESFKAHCHTEPGTVPSATASNTIKLCVLDTCWLASPTWISKRLRCTSTDRVSHRQSMYIPVFTERTLYATRCFDTCNLARPRGASTRNRSQLAATRRRTPAP